MLTDWFKQNTNIFDWSCQWIIAFNTSLKLTILQFHLDLNVKALKLQFLNILPLLAPLSCTAPNQDPNACPYRWWAHRAAAPCCVFPAVPSQVWHQEGALVWVFVNSWIFQPLHIIIHKRYPSNRSIYVAHHNKMRWWPKKPQQDYIGRILYICLNNPYIRLSNNGIARPTIFLCPKQKNRKEKEGEKGGISGRDRGRGPHLGNWGWQASDHPPRQQNL